MSESFDMCDSPEEQTGLNELWDGPTRTSVDHFDVDANVTLISSDGVEFRVWDYELKAGR
jgi:hypothetical protein